MNYVTCLDLGGWGAVYTEGGNSALNPCARRQKDKVAITNELVTRQQQTKRSLCRR
ncbi:MAG: hypothetical protein ACLR9W_09190 [Enterobacter hormaechei]